MDVRTVMRKVQVGGPDTTQEQKMAVYRRAEEMLRKVKLKFQGSSWQVSPCEHRCSQDK